MEGLQDGLGNNYATVVILPLWQSSIRIKKLIKQRNNKFIHRLSIIAWRQYPSGANCPYETGLNCYLPCFTVYHFSKTILNLPQNYYPQNIERESSERQKAMADLPHMKRFKTNMKRRRIKQILQDVTGSPCVFCILKLLLDATLLNFASCIQLFVPLLRWWSGRKE